MLGLTRDEEFLCGKVFLPDPADRTDFDRKLDEVFPGDESKNGFGTPKESDGGINEPNDVSSGVLLELELKLKEAPRRNIRLVDVGNGKKETVPISPTVYGAPRTRPPKGFTSFLDDERPEALLPSAFIEEKNESFTDERVCEGALVHVQDGGEGFPTPTEKTGEKSDVQETSFRPVGTFGESNIILEMLDREEIFSEEEADKKRDELMEALSLGTWVYTPKTAHAADTSPEESIPTKENVGGEPNVGVEVVDTLLEIPIMECGSEEDLLEEILPEVELPDTTVSIVEIAEEGELLHELEETAAPPIQDDEASEDEVEDTTPLPEIIPSSSTHWGWRFSGVMGIILVSVLLLILFGRFDNSSPPMTPSVKAVTAGKVIVPSVAIAPVVSEVVPQQHCTFINGERPVGNDGRPIVKCDEGTFTVTARYQKGGVYSFTEFKPHPNP